LRKTHMKLGMLIVMTCLFLAAGTFATGGTVSAHSVKAPKHFEHWFAHAPSITVKMLPNTAHHSNVARADVYGVGFNSCSNDCTPCSSDCSTTPSTTSYVTTNTDNTDINTNTVTTTTTTITKSNNSSTTAPSVSTAPSTCPSDTCDNSAPNYAPTAPNSAPSAPSTCPSDTCGSSAPSYAPSAPSYAPTTPSDNGCSCNTVNLQSSAPMSAPGVNLSQIPVNPYGEFHVTVNVMPTARHHRHLAPSIWAINSYNDQPSNYATACCSVTQYCCQ